MTNATALPSREDAGCTGDWSVTDWSGRTRHVKGTFLGGGSTYRPFHKGHEAGTHALKKQHCSACRWSEIGLFREDGTDDGVYVIVNRGLSKVPGETERTSVAESSIETMVELTEIFKELGHGGMLLTGPAAEMLMQAAEYDDDLRQALFGRRS